MKNGINVLSLFDGISCGRVALERIGANVGRYVAYEIDKDAIKISNKNYPDIEHSGDVFKADFSKYKGFDILIGGSPCTHWSIARTDGTREVTNSGIGWDFFNQYMRALKESKCKYFLYENNFSISKEIKEEITKALGVEPIMINSALVSAQNRKRMYWTNIPNVVQPTDKNILLKDIIKPTHKWKELGKWVFNKWGQTTKIDSLKDFKREKSSTLTTSKTHPMNYYLNKTKTMYTNLDSEEWEKLQTLPVGYTSGISEGKRHKAIGNGWTVDVIAHILSFANFN